MYEKYKLISLLFLSLHSYINNPNKYENIMKLFLYAALPLALIALGSCSYPKNITFKADSQTGALSGLYLTSDTSMNWILRTDGTQYEWVDSRYGWGLGHLRINGTEYSWNIPTKNMTRAIT